MPFPFLATASIAAPLVQSFIQNRMNKKMSDYTYSKDLAMWEKQNQYNAPAMQMRRYGEAGLNPNLIYSQGNAGNPASMPKYNPPNREIKIPDTLAILQQFQDFALKTQEISNAKLLNETNEKKLQILGIEEALKNLKLNTSDPAMFKEANKYWQIPDGKSSTEYSLDAQRLKNVKSEKELDLILNKIGITQQQKNWLEYKYTQMQNTGVNIDKDAVWMRILSDFFGDSIKQFKNYVKPHLKF